MPSANTAKGMIQATRLKPVAVGAAITVGPYCCTKPWRMRSSLSPLSRAAMSWSRILSEDWQPTWLHSSRIWPHPQVHIMRWPRSLKRASVLGPAPTKRKTAAVRMRAWRARRLKRRLIKFNSARPPGNLVVPPGLESPRALFPALKRWANMGRPSGAGLRPSFESKSDRSFSRTGVSAPHSSLIGEFLGENFISVACSCVRGCGNRRGCGYRDGDGIGHESDYRSEDHDDQADPDPGHEWVQVRFDDRATGGFVLAFVDQIDVVDRE